MSTQDLKQLFYLSLYRNGDNLPFGIVFSPRNKGLKALCVRLTNDGFLEVERVFADARRNNKPVDDCLKDNLRNSANIYAQIPFNISYESCTVVDLRDRSDVVSQLSDFVRTGNADKCWV